MRCRGCRCTKCTQLLVDTKDIKLMLEKLRSAKVLEIKTEAAVKTVNLFGQDLPEALELSINHAYKDSGRQLMILDCRALVSLAGVSWMEQYLQEFNPTIDQMTSTECRKPFVFGPSKRYISTSRIDLPILIVRKDGREYVLTDPTYLVDTKVPFLCGKKT